MMIDSNFKFPASFTYFLPPITSYGNGFHARIGSVLYRAFYFCFESIHCHLCGVIFKIFCVHIQLIIMEHDTKNKHRISDARWRGSVGRCYALLKVCSFAEQKSSTRMSILKLVLEQIQSSEYQIGELGLMDRVKTIFVRGEAMANQQRQQQQHQQQQQKQHDQSRQKLQ